MVGIIQKLFVLLSAGWSLSSPPEVIFRETFDYPDGELPSMFWNEGCKAEIKNGRLFVDADTTKYRASTIWLDREFSGNVSVEFDAYVTASSDTADNINFFFMYSDPSGKPLRESASERSSGLYSLYHKLNGYIFTNVTNGHPTKIRYRFRENPGFKLLGEAFLENKSTKTRNIRISKVDDRFRYWVDNQLVLDVKDDRFGAVREHGWMGLRTWHTALWIDNLVVRRLDE